MQISRQMNLLVIILIPVYCSTLQKLGLDIIEKEHYPISLLEVLKQRFPVRFRRDGETSSLQNLRTPPILKLLKGRKLAFAPDLDESSGNSVQNWDSIVSVANRDQERITYDHHHIPSKIAVPEEKELSILKESIESAKSPNVTRSETGESLKLESEEVELMRTSDSFGENVTTSPKLVFEKEPSRQVKIRERNESIDSSISSSIPRIIPKTKILQNGTFHSSHFIFIPEIQLNHTRTGGGKNRNGVNETRTMINVDSIHAEEVRRPLETFLEDDFDFNVLLTPFLEETVKQKEDEIVVPASNAISSIVHPHLENRLSSLRSSLFSTIETIGIIFISILTLGAFFSQVFFSDFIASVPIRIPSSKDFPVSNSSISDYSIARGHFPRPFELKQTISPSLFIKRRMSGQNRINSIRMSQGLFPLSFSPPFFTFQHLNEQLERK